MRKVLIFLAVVLMSVSFVFQGFAMQVGGQAPSFTGTTITGDTISLDGVLQNKDALLVFWTTWCPSCISEIPEIEKFYKENKNEIAVIGINAGESKDKVQRFIDRQDISYPVVIDEDQSISKSYGLVGVPTLVLIGSDHLVKYYGHSVSEMMMDSKN